MLTTTSGCDEPIITYCSYSKFCICRKGYWLMALGPHRMCAFPLSEDFNK